MWPLFKYYKVVLTPAYLVDAVVTEIHVQNFLSPISQVISEYRHGIVREIDLPESIGYPRIARQCFLGDERYPIVT